MPHCFFHDLRIRRIISCRHVGGKSLRRGQHALKCIRVNNPCLFQKIQQEQLEIPGFHSGISHASDLFLVCEDADCRLRRRLLQRKQRRQRRIGADSVILPVSRHHTLVKSQRSRLHGRAPLRSQRCGNLPPPFRIFLSESSEYSSSHFRSPHPPEERSPE